MNFARGRSGIGVIVVAVALVTGALSATVAGATAGPSLSVVPGGPVLNGQRVEVAGAGLASAVNGVVVECNDAPGQPTVESQGIVLPVSCTDPFTLQFPYSQWVITTSASGAFDTTVVIRTGVIGPPSDTATLDSAGTDPTADAARYPCPPTSAQQAAGIACTLSLSDGGGDHVQTPLLFAPPLTGHPSVRLQGAGVGSGNTVTVTASGLTPDSPTLVEECNLSPGEPAATFNPGPAIGCTPPVGGPDPFNLPVSSDTGQLEVPVTVSEGNLGQLSGSAPYPCPPTPAEQAAGGTCDIVVEDSAMRVGASPLALTEPPPVPHLVVDAGHRGLLNGQQVIVSGTGFSADNSVTLYECNETPGEATVEVQGLTLPVGCDNPLAAGVFQTGFASTGPDGSLAPTPFTVFTGFQGPPQGGTAIGGGYSCPPTPAQELAGATCDIVFTDNSGEVVSVPITFDSPRVFDPTMLVTAAATGQPVLTDDPLAVLPTGTSLTMTLSGFTPDSSGLLLSCPFVPTPLQAMSFLEGPCSLTGSAFWVPPSGNVTMVVPDVSFGSEPAMALVAVDAAGDRAIADTAVVTAG